jgi:hypothetical protein
MRTKQKHLLDVHLMFLYNGEHVNCIGRWIMSRLLFLRDFFAIAGFFAVLYGWFVIGSALVA